MLSIQQRNFCAKYESISLDMDFQSLLCFQQEQLTDSTLDRSPRDERPDITLGDRIIPLQWRLAGGRERHNSVSDSEPMSSDHSMIGKEIEASTGRVASTSALKSNAPIEERERFQLLVRFIVNSFLVGLEADFCSFSKISVAGLVDLSGRPRHMFCFSMT